MRPAALFLSLLVFLLVLKLAPSTVATQTLRSQNGSQVLTVAPAAITELRAWDAEVTRMARDGELRALPEREDTLMPHRRHERLAQYHDGLRIFGAEVTRQSENGVPISMLGTLYQNVDVSTTPRLTREDARAVMLAQPDAATVIAGPELMILPLDAGGFALVYRLVTTFPNDILISFVDAGSGAILLQYTDIQTQGIAGTGVGVLGDTKKVSTTQAAGTYQTSDALRPPSILTYDMKGNLTRVTDVLNRRVTLGASDLAADSDNNWTDGAIVDGHVYAGWTYDYYFKRFGRRGLDNNNLPIVSLIHPVNRDSPLSYIQQNSVFFNNAFWSGTLRLMVYGVGLPSNITSGGQRWNFTSGSIDIVAHELTHGVTQFTSNLTYRGEPGALNEAFSDIIAAGAEFYYASVRGRAGNYLVGDDVVTPGGIRSMENPAAYDDPDHYSTRYLGSGDNLGVHINSAIPNQAFYLAIEGGTNRTSRLSVQGVGGANREQIERVFYRAFTQMLTASSNFLAARVATIQSARDLYGANSAAERAVTQAWEALGVRSQAAQIAWAFSAASPVPPAPAGACSLPSPNFRIAAQAAEGGGVGFNVTSSQIRFYDLAGTFTNSQALNFAQTFNACSAGSSRIPPLGLPCTPQLCVSFGGAGGGSMDFVLQGVDDLGTPHTFTSPRVRFGTATASEQPAQATQGSFMVKP